MSLKATTLLFGAGGSAAVLTPTPTWIQFDFTFAQFAAAAMNTAITLYSLPAGGQIGGAKLKHSASFDGTGIASVEASVGIVGSLELRGGGPL